MPGERLRHRGQHARRVGDVERHVVPGDGLPHRPHGQVRVRGRLRAARAGQPVAGHRHHVAQHRAGRGRAAGAGAVEHQPPRRLRLHEHRVVRPAHPGERVPSRDHRRVRPHAHAGAVGRLLADGQHLHHAAHLARAGDVGRGDLGDALAVHVRGRDPAVERETGQDGGLGRGVEALHVGGRVGLRVAQLLRLVQRVGEAGAAGVHLVEDVVGGAVDDAQHPVHPIAGQRLAQWTQQRDRAGHAGLVVQVSAVLGGRGVQGRTVGGQQRLVGRHHRLAGLHRGQDQRARRLDAADDLDDDVDVVARGQRHRVGREQARPGGHATFSPRTAHRDPGQLQRRADPGGQVVRLLAQEPDHLRPDVPAAQEGHLERFHASP